MRDEVIFEITKDQLETGMRGIPVGYCVTSQVDPEKGLYYKGVPISELSSCDPVEVIYLLYHGQRGNDRELNEFRKDLQRRSEIDQSVIYHVQALPKQGRPMEMFAAALLILGMHEKTEDYREDCLNLIAKLPSLAATLINYHAGWGETPKSRPELGYMQNFVHMLNVPGSNKEMLSDVLRMFNILHFDHGGGNLSAFTSKAIASGLQNLYASIAGGMAALGGPLHGRANQDCLNFVKKIHDELGDDASADDIEHKVRELLEQHKKVFGFGHAVLRVEDPRASLFYEYGKQHFEGDSLFKLALQLRERGSKVLGEDGKVSDPHPNVDAISGTILSAAGFPYPEYFTVLFGLSRSVGIAIQIVYERCIAREGKGLPIIRPKYLYKNLSSNS